MDVTKLLLPYEPADILSDLAVHRAAHPDSNIERVHIFPLGGIKASATWTADHGSPVGVPAASA